MKKLGLILILSIVACSWAKPITWPNGAKGWMVQCTDEVDCFTKDGEVCSIGYNRQWHDFEKGYDFIICHLN